MSPSDPYKTQPLTPITQTLSRSVTLPVPIVVALTVILALLLVTLMLVWNSILVPTSVPVVLLATPTLGIARGVASPHVVALPRALAHAAVAYAAPSGAVVGALEPGRAYAVTARSGMAWVQINVARSGETSNLVWVATADVPEVDAVVALSDLATPAPTTTPQIVSVAVSIAPNPTTSTYLIPPATPAPRSVVMRTVPTALPCTLRELGSVLRICNGVTP